METISLPEFDPSLGTLADVSPAIFSHNRKSDRENQIDFSLLTLSNSFHIRPAICNKPPPSAFI
jgi:hypothetical protein